jgi:hypothetical protein
MFQNPRRAATTLATAATTITMLTAGAASAADAQSPAAAHPAFHARDPVRRRAAPPVPGEGLEDLAHREAVRAGTA